MDALTGSYAKLRNNEVPLEERIELCRNILRNSEYFLPNKSQLIVDWLSQELSPRGRKRDKERGEQETELWKILSEVFISDPKSDQIFLRQNFLPILFRELNEIKSFLGSNCSENGLNEMTQERVLSVFLCFQAISKSPTMSLTFFNKLENLEKYVKEVLICFLGVLLQPVLHSANFVEELFHVVAVVLRQYATAQQQVAQRKVFTNLCEKLLHLLLLVRAVMKDGKVLSSNNLSKEDIGFVIDAVIVSGLFHKDLVLNYIPTAMPRQQAEPSPKKIRVVNSYNQLFDVLESFAKGGNIVENINLRPDLVHQTLDISLPFLLENFLKATQDDNKLDRASKFSFFVELYNVIAQTSDLLDKHPPEITRIEILNKMLHILVDYDVYQIAEDNVNNEPIFKWFRNLMERELLSHSQNNAARFHFLDIILKLNHKIIEESLEIVLEQCLAESECSKAKIELLCDIVGTYTKLQQIDNLVTCLLKVFNRLGSNFGSIPVDVLAKLSRSFEHCSINKTLSISQLFLDEMKKKVESIEDDENDLSMTAISILFVTFLLNSSYNAADTHGLDETKVTNLTKLLEDIKVSVITPLIKAFPSCKKTCQEQVGFSTLYLVHGFNGLVLFLHQHDVIPTSDDRFVKVLWDSKLKACIPDETWRSMTILRKNGCLRFCMELLAVHRMQYMLLKQNLGHEFDHLLNFLYSFQDPQEIPELSSISWNFDPSSVNSTNYPVAHWSLAAQYAPVFIPYCSESHLQNIAESLVGTLVLREKEITSDNSITLHQVSENILKDGELLASSLLQAAVVRQFWKLLGECLSHVVGDKLAGVFTREVLEDQTAHFEDVNDEDETRPPDESGIQSGRVDTNSAISLAQMISKVMNDTVRKSLTKRSKKMTCGDVSMVAHLLKVLQRLPCHQFAQSNQVHCILGSLASDLLLGKTSPDNQCLAVQLSCREILTTLLQGSLQHREYSAWRVVDMASLLRWLYHTILHENQAATKTSPTNLQCKFLNASKELLRLAVILSLKSPSRASLTAIVDFSHQLTTSLTDFVKNASSEIIRCVDVLFTLVSACKEFLDQKGKNKSSLKTACSIISNTMVSLASFTKSTLEEESCVELENVVMKLCGILTRTMRLISETELSKNEDFTDALEGWTEIVSLLVAKVLRKMEDEENPVSGSDVNDEIANYITVLEDVLKGCPEHCAAISDEIRSQILRKCLEILRKTGFPFGEEASNDGPKGSKESSKLQEAVLGLIVGLHEEDGGRNCITVLDGVLEWSVEGSEASKDTSLNLLTGLSVFRDLLAMKVAKQNKKEVRPVMGKIMITLLSRALVNVKILCVVLEAIAALVCLGSGVFYPQDLALVFQALALNLEVTNLGLFSRIFMARFAILSWTLFYYPDYVYGAVHVFLPCLRELLHSLLTQGAKISAGKIDVGQASILSSCVQKMSRLYQEMASHKDVLSKYSIYFLADCVHVMSTQGVPAMIRDVLVQGVHFLFDICNDDGLTKLHVYLPNNERELFRSLNEDYMKHHKFKGNA